MASLYLIRHALTEFSLSGKIAGSTDIGLSDEGRRSIASNPRLSRSIQSTPCVASDQKRAIQTAQEFELEIKDTDSRLREMHFGAWETLTWDQVHQQYPDELHYWSEDWVNRAPTDGESFKSVFERCEEWLQQRLARVKHEDIIVIAHGGSLRALFCALLNIPLKHAMRYSFDHIHATKVELLSTGNRCKYLNCPLSTVLPDD